MFLIIIVFRIYLSERNNIGNLNSRTRDFSRIIVRESLQQIKYLQQNKAIYDFIESFVDSKTNNIVKISLNSRQYYRLTR